MHVYAPWPFASVTHTIYGRWPSGVRGYALSGGHQTVHSVWGYACRAFRSPNHTLTPTYSKSSGTQLFATTFVVHEQCLKSTVKPPSPPGRPMFIAWSTQVSRTHSSRSSILAYRYSEIDSSTSSSAVGFSSCSDPPPRPPRTKHR